jgi:oligopeptidase A
MSRTKDQEQSSENPLLRTGIPNFNEISAELVKPAIDQLIAKVEKDIVAIEDTASPTWGNIVKPLQNIEDEIEAAWSPVGHLMAVRNSDDLRKSYEENLPRLIKLQLRISQSAMLFQHLLKIREDSAEVKDFDEARRRVLDQMIKEIELSGIALLPEVKERFNEISDRLSQCSNEFSNNVLDAVKNYDFVVHKKEQLKGCPAWYLQLASEQFNQRIKNDKTQSVADKGPWLVTLDQPNFLTIMKYCGDRGLRQKLYTDYIRRASEGRYDNSELIAEILSLRDEKAQLLGFKSYAELSLSRKMAGSVSTVEKLLNELKEASYQAGVKEAVELGAFAKEKDGLETLARWDEHYYAELLQEQKFGFNEEELKPYFPLPGVMKGLFNLVEKIFEIKVVDSDGNAPVWDQDVRFFDVLDNSSQKIASFFIDPYSRPENKRGGAWMNECLSRRLTDGQVQNPIAYLVCNFPRPIGDDPALLTFRDVQTLFHEFGHGLQHMLTDVNEPGVAGIRGVEWDAVELPSQFMENWCYDRDTVAEFARHHQTGAVLPDELFTKLVAARTYRSASFMLRQLHFSFIDLELHHQFKPAKDGSVFDVDRRLAKQILPIQPIPEDRMLCSFAHIFAGGYAAGYYSYKWAEVLSADAFSVFEKNGLEQGSKVREVGVRFRKTILAKGGSEHPMEVFKKFVGREPSTAALLRHNGLTDLGS